MSELDLQFGEPASRSRHRRAAAPPPRRSGQEPPRRSRRKPRRQRRGGRSFVAFLLVLLLLGGLTVAGWWAVNWVRDAFTTPDYAGPGHGSIMIEIRDGDTGLMIANKLYEQDIVASGRAFVEACNAEPLCGNIQPGFYELRQQMNAREALTLLLDPDNRQVEWVTIPEGLSKFRTYALLSEQLDIPVEEFEQAESEVLETVPDWWFNRSDDRQAEESLEGFLFPDTYDFPPDVTARSALETMVNRFLTVTGELGFADRVESERNISPYVALIAASLAQAEAGIESDMGKVARVAYNRVYSADMPLEMDVTYNYWLEIQGEDTVHSGQMTRSDLHDPNNPYSSHAHRGWMPSPINSPGQAALEAAMDPPAGDWLFFVAINEQTGESAFAVTNDEHNANIRIACQNGVPLSVC